VVFVKKVVGMIVLGLGGLVAAVALTVGALALAGDEVGRVVQPSLAPSSGDSRSDDPTTTDEPSASPSPDDHGGKTSASDDPPGDDHGGSTNSGSGSTNSGSGSSNSGSGSDDD